MKSYCTALLMLIGVTLTSCSHHLPNTSPAVYNPTCYVNIYEHSGFRGEVVQLQGPATYATLHGLKGRNWEHKIGSVQTGPGCWRVLCKDADFKGSHIVVAPNTTASSLGKMDDKSKSLQVLDHAP
jgi:hypothetical protein